MMFCILCKSDNIHLKEKINKDLLISLYKRAFAIDISHIVIEDVCYWHCEDCDLRFLR